jgi:flagellar L-ring protein precursor FlgH
VASNKNEKEEKFDLKDVESIPSKIVEKMSDDTYRIRGQQYLTIKKKPYKVIATALVRAEDFNDAGVSSNKLLDAQYDVIHVKRATE